MATTQFAIGWVTYIVFCLVVGLLACREDYKTKRGWSRREYPFTKCLLRYMVAAPIMMVYLTGLIVLPICDRAIKKVVTYRLPYQDDGYER